MTKKLVVKKPKAKEYKVNEIPWICCNCKKENISVGIKIVKGRIFKGYQFSKNLTCIHCYEENKIEYKGGWI